MSFHYIIVKQEMRFVEFDREGQVTNQTQIFKNTPIVILNEQGEEEIVNKMIVTMFEGNKQTNDTNTTTTTMMTTTTAPTESGDNIMNALLKALHALPLFDQAIDKIKSLSVIEFAAPVNTTVAHGLDQVASHNDSDKVKQQRLMKVIELKNEMSQDKEQLMEDKVEVPAPRRKRQASML